MLVKVLASRATRILEQKIAWVVGPSSRWESESDVISVDFASRQRHWKWASHMHKVQVGEALPNIRVDQPDKIMPKNPFRSYKLSYWDLSIQSGRLEKQIMSVSNLHALPNCKNSSEGTYTLHCLNWTTWTLATRRPREPEVWILSRSKTLRVSES